MCVCVVSTPVGFIRLFGIVSQVLTKKPLIKYERLRRQETSGERSEPLDNEPKDHSQDTAVESKEEEDKKLLNQDVVATKYPFYCIREKLKLEQRPFLQRLEQKRSEFEALHKSWPWKQNFLYPLAMLMLLFFNGITILLVVQNTLELLIGFKALPLSTRVS